MIKCFLELSVHGQLIHINGPRPTLFVNVEVKLFVTSPKALFVWMAEVKEELSKPQTPSLADLLIAYYNQRNAGAWKMCIRDSSVLLLTSRR